MEALIMIGQLLLGLSILVVLHEWGHFAAARYFGIKVEKFYLFFDAFNFRLFKFKKGDTEYGIGWLPLGGYVKIAGMIDESMDKEQMKEPPKPWEFRTKPAWQRLIVMLGGVTVNTILGILIFWMATFVYGEEYLPNEQVKNGIVAYPVAQEIGFRTGDHILAINGKPLERFHNIRGPEVLYGNSDVTVLRGGETLNVHVPESILNKISEPGVGPEHFIAERMTFFVKEIQEGSGAANAGLQRNDRIQSINGESVRFFDELVDKVQDHKGEEVDLTIERDGKTMSLVATISDEGLLGIGPGTNDFEYKTLKFGLVESFGIGMDKAWGTATDYVKGLERIVSGKVSAQKSVQGPIGIAKIYGGEWKWPRFWILTGFLSIVLAFMNLLPIPALDGGHAMFLVIEMIKGGPLNEKIMERAQLIGLAILGTLMLFIFGNDIWRLFQ
ncbi:MAG: RIP metalloprotease RseP [Flavobacteriales bacterium]|nr:RIP metalloprotease RseP [Flavobacteriales bacterium]